MLGTKFAGQTVIQAAKFGMIGVSNTLVDLGLFNFLLLFFGITTGVWLSVFKAISYSAGLVNSYVWNRRWTFRITGASGKGEIGKFLATNAVALVANVVTTTLLGTMIGPQFGIPEVLWVNISAIIATGVALVVNFIGYKFLVFRV